MVIDYRALNEKTIGDAYPLPNITDILDQLGNAKYFSILDLTSRFHQIPMDPKDAPKTAFSLMDIISSNVYLSDLKTRPLHFKNLWITFLWDKETNFLFTWTT